MSNIPVKDSKHFCMMPWTHLHVWPSSQVHLCCASDASLPPLGHLSEEVTLKDIWNSPRMKEVRTEMLKDNPIPECHRCYELESSGSSSMRIEHNKSFIHHLDKVSQTDAEGFLPELNMPYMDIRFSNICNFRCRTCGPDLSSKWYKDALALNMPMGHSKAIIHPTADPLNLWQQIEDLLPHVEQIYFAGGEPLIMDEHYRILNWLVENKRFDVELRYNTNFSVTVFQGQDVFELWKKFKKVEVGASLDSFGKRAEYARKETDWNLIESNRKRMLEVCPQVNFYVSCTLSLFSFSTMAEFHRDWVEKGFIDINAWNINPLTYPHHYRVQVTPEEYRVGIAKKYQDHIDWLKQQPGHAQFLIDRWNSALAFIRGPQLTDQTNELKKITKQLDNIREESFGNIFPEMAFMMNE